MRNLLSLLMMIVAGLSAFSQEIPEMPKVIPENWLTYHLAHPGPGVAYPGDPNCAFYYKGRYHLHYIYKNNDGYSFAHVSSSDMVTWKWHPTVLNQTTTGHGMYSGTGFFTKEGQPAIIYHGEGSQKNFISFALDDNLDVWSKPMPVEPKTASDWGGWDFFAPESLLARDGRRVMWAWCLLEGAQSGIQCLPRELSLPKDGVLRIKPLRELEKLRYDQCKEGRVKVMAGANRTIQTRGDIVELNITIKPTQATEFGVNVFCDANGKGLPITIKPGEKIMTLGEKKVPFELLNGEALALRVFLDRGMVEVFLNDRQAVAGMQLHEKENVGISLFSKGDDLESRVTSWKMKSIYD